MNLEITTIVSLQSSLLTTIRYCHRNTTLQIEIELSFTMPQALGKRSVREEDDGQTEARKVRRTGAEKNGREQKSRLHYARLKLLPDAIRQGSGFTADVEIGLATLHSQYGRGYGFTSHEETTPVGTELWIPQTEGRTALTRAEEMDGRHIGLPTIEQAFRRSVDFDVVKDGAMLSLKPRAAKDDGAVKMGYPKYDPNNFEAVEFGPSKVPALSKEQQKQGLWIWEVLMFCTIRERRLQALDESLIDTAEDPFCEQQRQLFILNTESEILDRLRQSTTEQRRVAIGLFGMGDELMEHLPRATADELHCKLVYVDYAKRRRQNGGYVGSGTNRDGGWARLWSGYEIAKRYANDGTVRPKDSARNAQAKDEPYSSRHLEFALEKDAEMHIRVVAVLPAGMTADWGVLFEGLYTDLYTTLAGPLLKRSSKGFVQNSSSQWLASICATPAEALADRSYVGLNETSPFAQGSNTVPGSGWLRAAPTGMVVTWQMRGEAEGCCICHERRVAVAWVGCKVPGYKNSPMCEACRTSWRFLLKKHGDEDPSQATIESWREDRKVKICSVCSKSTQAPYKCKHKGHEGKPLCQSCATAFERLPIESEPEQVTRLMDGRRQGDAKKRGPIEGCITCSTKKTVAWYSCAIPGKEDGLWCHPCRNDWAKGGGSDIAEFEKRRQRLQGVRDGTAQAPKSIKQQGQEDGCVFCGRKDGLFVKGKVPGYEDKATCTACALNWPTQKPGVTVEAWIQKRKK